MFTRGALLWNIGCNSHFHLKDVLLTEPPRSEDATRNAEWKKGCFALSSAPAAEQDILNFFVDFIAAVVCKIYRLSWG